MADYESTDRGLHSQGSGSSEKQKQGKGKFDLGKFAADGKFEQLAHLGALGATAIAKFEGEQARKAEGDTVRVEKHRKQEKLANSVALGLGGFAVHDKPQKQNSGTQGAHTAATNPDPNAASHSTSHAQPASQPAQQQSSHSTSEHSSTHSQSSKPSSAQEYFEKFEEGKKLFNTFLNKK